MVSVQDVVKCPRCKLKRCFDELYHRTGERYIQCYACGFHYRCFYKRDEDQNLIKKDPSKPSGLDNVILEEVLYENPCGTYAIEYKGGGGEFGTLVTEADLDEILQRFEKTDKSEISSFTISRLIDGKIKVTTIYGARKKGGLT